MTAVVDAEARHCKSGIHLKADSIKESICTRGRSHLSIRPGGAHGIDDN